MVIAGRFDKVRPPATSEDQGSERVGRASH